jgi:gliding motility-associated-like protein
MKSTFNHIVGFTKLIVLISLFIVLQNKLYSQYQNMKSVNCDSLYPNKSVVVLDTTLKTPSPVLLTPLHGTIDGFWNPSSYLSCLDCQTPTATPERSITYTVNLIDEYQCMHIEVFRIRFELKIPHVITPNDDHSNDYFIIRGLPDKTPIRIFDKDGVLVYSVDSYNESNWWNGTDNKGDPVQAGTYWYVLDNPIAGIFEKGFVYLIR